MNKTNMIKYHVLFLIRLAKRYGFLSITGYVTQWMKGKLHKEPSIFSIVMQYEIKHISCLLLGEYQIVSALQNVSDN